MASMRQENASRPTEGFVRSVFQRTNTRELPIFKTFVIATSGTTTVYINPPLGTIWSLNYVSILLTTSAASASINILMGNAVSTTYSLARKATTAVGDTASWGAFGNGPLILTPDFYLILQITGTAGNIADCIVALEVVS